MNNKVYPISIVASTTCKDNIYDCNEFIYNIDDVVNYNGDYINELKLKKHLSKTKNCELTKCCDKSINNYYLLPDNIKKENHKINTITNEIISKSEYDNLFIEEKKKYRCPTSYEVCKYNQFIKGEDCPEAMCKNVYAYKHPFKQFVYDNDTIHLQNELLKCIKADNVLLLEQKLHTNYDINEVLLVSFPGNTLIFEAIMHDANNCALFLLKENLDLNIKNKDGNTALHVACLKGNSTIGHNLLLLGADITFTNKMGETPLMCAIRSGNYYSVTNILNNGGSVHEKNNNNENPLFIAVTTPKKNFSIISMLVDMGCDILDKNNNSKSMLEVLNKNYKNTDIGKQIRTLLINTIIKLKGDNYYQIINDMPEFSVLHYEYDPAKLEKGDIDVTMPNYTDVAPDNNYINDAIRRRRKLGINKDALVGNTIENFTDGPTNVISPTNAKDSILEFIIGILIIIIGIGITFYLIRK